jgi:hypothetical protein
MGQSLIKEPRRIWSLASSGIDPLLDERVTYLEENEYKITYFTEINNSTGTITKPTNSTILVDQFFGGIDAYVSTIQNGQPAGIFPKTSGGVDVDVTSFNTLGDFVLTGTPSSYPVALIYILKIQAKDYQNLNINNILDLENINIKLKNTEIGFGNVNEKIVSSPNLTFTNNILSVGNVIQLTSAAPDTAIAGKINFFGDKFTGVITSGNSRKDFVLADTPLTSGRIVFTTTNGRAIDSGNLAYNGTILSVGQGASGAISTSRYRIGPASESFAFYNTASPSLPSGAIAAFEFGFAGTATGTSSFSSRLNASTSMFIEAHMNSSIGYFNFVNGKATLSASTSGRASLNVPIGVAPSSPINGDVWFDGTDYKARVNGVTKTFTLV